MRPYAASAFGYSRNRRFNRRSASMPYTGRPVHWRQEGPVL